ncbi:two-component sensor histidine kinase [Alistipes sp. OttesenSCG-928-B03]|nr:two-component sensor histidine kinase [Alistipes sp. OttesenSCG-928-B03]
MKLNFQQKLIASFLVIFAVFTAGIVVFEQQRARRYKTEALQERLDAYADQIFRYISTDEERHPSPDSLLTLMPRELRLTLVGRGGQVLYDNALADAGLMENHSDRPEIADALAGGSGTFIRRSATVNQPYLYYAKDNGGQFIVRVALPYDIHVQSFLKPDNAFLYFSIALFLAGIVFIFYVSRRFGRSVRHLRDFSASLNDTTDVVPLPDFPDDELGQVAGRLAEDFNRIRQHEEQTAREREKLLLHIQTSAEGVCFFNPDRTVAFYNGLFMQYFNMLSGGTLAAGRRMPDDAAFHEVAKFLDDPGDDNYYEARIGSRGKEFVLRLNIFEDSSFEIILSDVTAQEKNRRLKQEMTGNIAHELRTPVTSIRGFLEILLDNELPEEKSHEYLERAYTQTKNLSQLISDMSLLTRIDERQDAFDFSNVDINRLLERVRSDASAALSDKRISFAVDIPQGMTVKGNESLLYSVFRNLTDNVIHHAGDGVAIEIGVAGVKDGMVRFSFADNGKGIADEKHLARLFERFYRVNEGRTRDTGGSGLGLSIVKNAVGLHGGTITARNRSRGGLEFLFDLPE